MKFLNLDNLKGALIRLKPITLEPQIVRNTVTPPRKKKKPSQFLE